MNEQRANEQRGTSNLSTADLAGQEGRRQEPEREPAGGIPNQGQGTAGQGDRARATDSVKTDGTKTTTQGAATPAHEKQQRDNENAMPLIPETAATGYRDRWSEIQTNFVDEPQDAVREADGLVADVIQRVAQRFAEERHSLEGQWSSGTEVSTEDLRQALQHYREFFRRLLAA